MSFEKPRDPEWFKPNIETNTKPEKIIQADPKRKAPWELTDERENFDDMGEESTGPNYENTQDENERQKELQDIIRAKTVTKEEMAIGGAQLEVKKKALIDWAAKKVQFEKDMIEKGISRNELQKTVLFHVMGGSSSIEGRKITSFDLKNGEIEAFIRANQ